MCFLEPQTQGGLTNTGSNNIGQTNNGGSSVSLPGLLMSQQPGQVIPGVNLLPGQNILPQQPASGVGLPQLPLQVGTGSGIVLPQIPVQVVPGSNLLPQLPAQVAPGSNLLPQLPMQPGTAPPPQMLPVFLINQCRGSTDYWTSYCRVNCQRGGNFCPPVVCSHACRQMAVFYDEAQNSESDGQ